MGCEIEELYTFASVQIDPAIENTGDPDTALSPMRLQNGAIAPIDNCRKAVYGYDQRVEISGSAGKIETANCYPNQTAVSGTEKAYRDLPLNFFMDRSTESFVVEPRSFARSVSDRTPTKVSGIDGRIPVLVAKAARKSHDENRPVRLEEITE